VVSVLDGQGSSGVGCCQAAACAHFGGAAKVAFFFSPVSSIPNVGLDLKKIYSLLLTF
jgi:hypothetical protein